jgi:hypothetical protein
MDAKRIIIKDDIPYIQYINLMDEKDNKLKAARFFEAFLDCDLEGVEKDEIRKASKIIAKKIQDTHDIVLSNTDHTIMLLMTFGMSYADACIVPSRIAMSYIKQQSLVREKKKEDNEKFLAELQAKGKSPLSKPVNFFDDEVKAIIEKELKKQ